VGGETFTETSANGTVASKSPEDGGGMLILFRAMDRVEGPGLGGRESSLLSESYEDMVSRLDLDCVDLDLRIWLCRRLRGGVGGRFCWD
jgi:hypothetical protein